METKRNTFGGSLGFVLAAAGSAVGLGNIWRFPYLAARGGGGVFVLVYLILALTFGFALLTCEVAIGRKTKQGPLTAYSKLKKGWKPLGILSCIIPMIIMPYYCAIGGWVIKFFITFVTGHGESAAQDGFFGGFITGTTEPVIFMVIFLVLVAAIVILGVNRGIESSSKIIMPALILLVLGISIYSLTLSHTTAGSDGQAVTRTGLEGLKVFLVPDFDGMTVSRFFSIVVDAMGQLFYSLSIAMGIMIAYGSYVSDKSNMARSINHIEWFDTCVAILAGVMIIPAVFVFMGNEGLESSGPTLMFVVLPKVFQSMGFAGTIVGFLFFAMVLFAALSSAVSILEAIVSSLIDEFHISRRKACIIESIIALVMGLCVCFGYNLFYFDLPMPTGGTGQVLDVMDYVSNNVFMPIVAISTCILVGWVIKTQVITDEITKNGEKFRRKRLFEIMIKYIAPVLLMILFLKSIGVLDLIINSINSAVSTQPDVAVNPV